MSRGSFLSGLCPFRPPSAPWVSGLGPKMYGPPQGVLPAPHGASHSCESMRLHGGAPGHHAHRSRSPQARWGGVESPVFAREGEPDPRRRRPRAALEAWALVQRGRRWVGTPHASLPGLMTLLKSNPGASASGGSWSIYVSFELGGARILEKSTGPRLSAPYGALAPCFGALGQPCYRVQIEDKSSKREPRCSRLRVTSFSTLKPCTQKLAATVPLSMALRNARGE